MIELENKEDAEKWDKSLAETILNTKNNEKEQLHHETSKTFRDNHTSDEIDTTDDQSNSPSNSPRVDSSGSSIISPRYIFLNNHNKHELISPRVTNLKPKLRPSKGYFKFFILFILYF